MQPMIPKTMKTAMQTTLSLLKQYALDTAYLINEPSRYKLDLLIGMTITTPANSQTHWANSAVGFSEDSLDDNTRIHLGEEP